MKAKLVGEKLPKPFRYKSEIPEKFTELWMSDMRVKDIAAYFNKNETTLRIWRDRLGLAHRRRTCPITVDEELFRRMWAKDVLVHDMAKALEVTERMIRRLRRRFGLPKRAGKMRRISDKKVKELWSSKLSVREICGELGISPSTLSVTVRRLGLPRRRLRSFFDKPLQIGQIDGVTFATDEEYEKLKAESMHVLKKIQNPSRSDDLIALRKKYRQLGWTMAQHMRILRVEPLKGKH